MDHADIAGTAVEACLADAEARARGRSSPEHHPDFDGTHCVEPDCGIAIPEARLALQRIRCVTCQSLIEQRAARAKINVRVFDD